MEFRDVRRRGSFRSARFLGLRRGVVALLGTLRSQRRSAEALRARLSELTDSWGEPMHEWSATPVDAEEPLSYVQLGQPALPLIRRFAEPALRVELHGDVVVVRFRARECEYAAAVWQAQIVAVRCWYRARETEAADRECEAVTLLDGPAGYRFLSYDHGWCMTLPDCPKSCLIALDRLRAPS